MCRRHVLTKLTTAALTSVRTANALRITVFIWVSLLCLGQAAASKLAQFRRGLKLFKRISNLPVTGPRDEHFELRQRHRESQTNVSNARGRGNSTNVSKSPVTSLHSMSCSRAVSALSKACFHSLCFSEAQEMLNAAEAEIEKTREAQQILSFVTTWHWITPLINLRFVNCHRFSKIRSLQLTLDRLSTFFRWSGGCTPICRGLCKNIHWSCTGHYRSPTWRACW